jgi:hypothetical protein
VKKALLLLLTLVPFASVAWADTVTNIQSYTPVLTGGTVANFEGFSEFTRITTQYPGMTFSQTGGGAPMIDNYNGSGGSGGCGGAAWCYAYGASSGSGVLTGSSDGGNIVTTAGIIVSFSSPQSEVQAFLADTAPLGDYTVSAYDVSNTLLSSLTVPRLSVLPPGYTGCGGGNFPPPGCTPLPGIYVGFEDITAANIASIQIGPSSTSADAFAIDDVQIPTSAPEPSSLFLLSSGVIALGGVLRRKLFQH